MGLTSRIPSAGGGRRRPHLRQSVTRINCYATRGTTPPGRIESAGLLLALAGQTGADVEDLRTALASGEADEAVSRLEALAHARGVVSTPTWEAGGQRISGLRPREKFAYWAAALPRWRGPVRHRRTGNAQ